MPLVAGVAPAPLVPPSVVGGPPPHTVLVQPVVPLPVQPPPPAMPRAARPLPLVLQAVRGPGVVGAPGPNSAPWAPPPVIIAGGRQGPAPLPAGQPGQRGLAPVGEGPGPGPGPAAPAPPPAAPQQPVSVAALKAMPLEERVAFLKQLKRGQEGPHGQQRAALQHAVWQSGAEGVEPSGAQASAAGALPSQGAQRRGSRRLDEECRVCLERVAFVALQPCGHRCMCEGCTRAWLARGQQAGGGAASQCLTCFEPVTGWSV